MRRRWLIFALALVAGVGGAAAWLRSRPAAPQHRPEQPFTDLGPALAAGGPSGWELHRPPSQPGPYRVFAAAGSSLLGGGGSMTCRVLDGGTLIEELRVEGDPAFDQLVLQLETLNGRRTQVVLKRPR